MGGNHTDVCKQFNRSGRCSYGKECKFEHRCLFCGKFGHPVINCRQLKYGGNGDKRNYERRDRSDYYDKKRDRRHGSGDKDGKNEVKYKG